MKNRAMQRKDAASGREPARLWSVMYPAHFRMSENPFTNDADPKFLWPGGRRREILADLEKGILDRAGVHVVLGAAGTGKTLLANAVVDELGDRALAVVVPCTEYKGIDFLKLAERAFGIGGDSQGGESLAGRFSDFLLRTAASGKAAVLIVDDAHRLSRSCLRELAEISELQENGTRLLQLVFFGENRFRDIVNDEVNRGLFESSGVRLTIDALTRDETAQYIRHRLRVAQCERELFTSDAVEEIFAFSKGVPGLINRACEAALSRAFYLGEQLVPQDTVREALKLMPQEKPTLARPSRNLSFEAAAASAPEREDESDDEDEPGIPAGQVRRRNRSWIAYAVLGCLLVALIAAASYVLKGRSPKISPGLDEKKATAPAPVPSVEKAAAPAVTVPKPDQPAMRETPPVPAVEQDMPKAEVRAAKKAREPSVSRTSAERSRRAAAKGPRRETAPAGTVAPAADTGRETPAERTETTARESEGRKAEQVESGEVIDWILKKRAGQK